MAGDAQSAGRRFAPHWLRREILSRDGSQCRYCRRFVSDETANVDHVVAWPEGLTVELNLVTCCGPCNQAKGSAYVIPVPLAGSLWFHLRRAQRTPEIDERTRRSRRRHVVGAVVHRRPIRDSWIREGSEAGKA